MKSVASPIANSAAFQALLPLLSLLALLSLLLPLLLCYPGGSELEAQQREQGRSGEQQSSSRQGGAAPGTGAGEGVASKDGNSSPKWYSNVDVARQVLKKFEDLESYTASFQIELQDGPRRRQMKGKLYYQKPGRLRYEFQQPAGNLVVSDGKIMWFYVNKLKVVGKQELLGGKGQKKGASLFGGSSTTGLRRLFQKYHYRFDSPDQPRLEHNRRSFVFDMEQREKVGSYERMRLYVDAGTYLVYRAEAEDNYGKSAQIGFSEVVLNDELEGKLFQYKPPSGVRVVPNPLVDEGGS